MAIAFKSQFTALEIEELLQKVFSGDGGVSTVSTLPSTGVENHLYIVESNPLSLYYFNGTDFVKISTGGGGGEPDHYITTITYVNGILTITPNEGSAITVDIPENMSAIIQQFESLVDNLDDRVSALEDAPKGVTKPFSELRYLDNYTYSIRYDGIDEDSAIYYFTHSNSPMSGGACSGCRKGNWWMRNYDWNYNNQVELAIEVPQTQHHYAYSGVASHANLTDKVVSDANSFNATLTDEAILGFNLLPFLMKDGINQYGVCAQVNVAPLDEGEDITSIVDPTFTTICERNVIYYVLAHTKSADEAITLLTTGINITQSPDLAALHFKCHYMIGDESKTYVVELTEEGVKYYALNYITNFSLYGVELPTNHKVPSPGNGTATSIGINEKGAGLERWNAIVDAYNTLDGEADFIALSQALHYTNAYQLENTWYSEFTGINGLTVDSPASAFSGVKQVMYQLYLDRDRDEGSTWHTSHITIYDIKNRSFKLFSQEAETYYTFSLIWYNADNIFFKDDFTLAGNYTSVGNVEKSAGTLSAAGKSVKDVIQAIFTKRLQPAITAQPAVTVTFGRSNETKEAGSVINYSGTNSASLSAGSYTYGPATGITPKTWALKFTAPDGTITQGTTASLAYSYNFTLGDSNKTAKFEATATYDQGAIAQDNLGDPSNPVVRIAAGSKSNSKTITYTTYRASFSYVGTNLNTLDGAWIRSNGKNEGNMSMPTSTSKNLTIAAGTKRVVFAIPKAKGYHNLKSVIDVGGMGLDIKDKFTHTELSVVGANNFTAVVYDVWYFENPNGLAASTFQFLVKA